MNESLHRPEETPSQNRPEPVAPGRAASTQSTAGPRKHIEKNNLSLLLFFVVVVTTAFVCSFLLMRQRSNENNGQRGGSTPGNPVLGSQEPDLFSAWHHVIPVESLRYRESSQSINIPDSSVVLNHVLITAQTRDTMTFVGLDENGCVYQREKRVLDKPPAKGDRPDPGLLNIIYDVQTARVQVESQKKAVDEIFHAWGKKGTFARVERHFGPELRLAGVKVTYGLPERVTYILGSPTVVQGPSLYVSTDSGGPAKVPFEDVRSIGFVRDKAQVRWADGTSSEAPCIYRWPDYPGGVGGEAELSGLNMDSLSMQTLPLRNVRSIERMGL